MKLEHAELLARDVVNKLRPHCDRIEIAGSIRRRKPEVGDIEIVCIPQCRAHIDLLGEQAPVRASKWIHAVSQLGELVKGDPETGRYVQVELFDELLGGMDVDIFTATRENWGLIYAIRTGSAAFSHKVLACGWVAKGYHSVDGMLIRDGVQVATLEEDDLFQLAGVPWCEPQYRDVKVRSCRVCGCTDADCSGCIERTGSPCHWVAADLCSACVSNVC